MKRHSKMLQNLSFFGIQKPNTHAVFSFTPNLFFALIDVGKNQILA